MNVGLDEQSYVVRAGLVVVLSTVVLTASFIGMLAVAQGAVVDIGDRFPVYLLGSAIVFVVTMFTLEDPRQDGQPIIATTVSIGIAALTLFTLSGEGLVYAARPGTSLLTPQIVLYAMAAALICTAIAYWALHHWREFTD